MNNLPDKRFHWLRYTVQVLRASGYREYISVEVLPRPSAAEAAAMAAHHLRPLLEEQ